MSGSRIISVDNRPRHLAGWRPDRADHRDKIYRRAVAPGAAAALPSSASLADVFRNAKWDNGIGIFPFDQGNIGDCTANAFIASVLFLYIKAELPLPELSRLFLYYVIRVCIEGAAPAEDPAENRDVAKAIASIGLANDTLYQDVDVTRFAEEPTAEAFADAQQRESLLYFALPSLDLVKSCIADGFPAPGGWSVPENAVSDACAVTGNVEYPAADEKIVGGHATLFTGYDDSTRRVEFLNSWGAWGNGGFGTLPYEFFDLGDVDPLADDFWTIRRIAGAGT